MPCEIFLNEYDGSNPVDVSWHCCYCEDGPLSFKWQTHCNCGHQLCREEKFPSDLSYHRPIPSEKRSSFYNRRCRENLSFNDPDIQSYKATKDFIPPSFGAIEHDDPTEQIRTDITPPRHDDLNHQYTFQQDTIDPAVLCNPSALSLSQSTFPPACETDFCISESTSAAFNNLGESVHAKSTIDHGVNLEIPLGYADSNKLSERRSSTGSFAVVSKFENSSYVMGQSKRGRPACKTKLGSRSPVQRRGNSRVEQHAQVAGLDTTQSTEPVRRISCPYIKRDPARYDGWRSCLATYPSVARLKDHLYRCHRLSNECTNCGHIYYSKKELNAHTDEMCLKQQGCPPPAKEGIDDGKYALLRKRWKGKPKDELGKWQEILQILFGKGVDMPFLDHQSVTDRFQRDDAPVRDEFAMRSEDLKDDSQQQFADRIVEKVVQCVRSAQTSPSDKLIEAIYVLKPWVHRAILREIEVMDRVPLNKTEVATPVSSLYITPRAPGITPLRDLNGSLPVQLFGDLDLPNLPNIFFDQSSQCDAVCTPGPTDVREDASKSYVGGLASPLPLYGKFFGQANVTDAAMTLPGNTMLEDEFPYMGYQLRNEGHLSRPKAYREPTDLDAIQQHGHAINWPLALSDPTYQDCPMASSAVHASSFDFNCQGHPSRGDLPSGSEERARLRDVQVRQTDLMDKRKSQNLLDPRGLFGDDLE